MRRLMLMTGAIVAMTTVARADSHQGGYTNHAGNAGGERRATIDGGSVRIGGGTRSVASDDDNFGLTNCVNCSGQPVFCVTATCPLMDGPVDLQDMEGYGTNDICAIKGNVHLWLPNGVHRVGAGRDQRTHQDRG